MRWDEGSASAAAAGRYSCEIYHGLRKRGRENACFYIIADQAGHAGYVDLYPRDSPNQTHHVGGALIFGSDGEILAESQADEIQNEMVVATLEAELLNAARRSPNYTLRTRGPTCSANWLPTKSKVDVGRCFRGGEVSDRRLQPDA